MSLITATRISIPSGVGQACGTAGCLPGPPQTAVYRQEMGRKSLSGPGWAGLRGSTAVRIGAAAVGAILVAEVAVWLLRPRGEIFPPAHVSQHAYFSQAQI